MSQLITKVNWIPTFYSNCKTKLVRECFQNLKPTELIVSFDTENNSKGFMKFSYKKLFNFLKNTPENFMYEFIHTDRRKMIYDYDQKLSPGEAPPNTTAFLETFRNCIGLAFQELFQINLAEENILFAVSSRTDKFSVHAIIDKYSLRVKDCKRLYKRTNELMGGNGLNLILDPMVYGSTQAFRLPKCRKRNAPNTKKMWNFETEVTEEFPDDIDVFKKYLACYLSDCEEVDLQDEEIVQQSSNEDVDESDWEYIHEIVRNIPARYADDYHTWIRHGFALSSFGERYRELFHEFSRQSSKYNEEAANRVFDCGNGQLGIWTLLNSLTPSVRSELQEKHKISISGLIQKYNGPINVLKSFDRFKPTIFCERYQPPLKEQDRTVAYKGACGTGKSTVLKQEIPKMKGLVVIISPKRNFASKIHRDLGSKFINYLDVANGQKIYGNRIIVSIESLHRVASLNHPDGVTIILDELGGIIQQTCSETVTKEQSIVLLKILMKRAKKIIAFDATMLAMDLECLSEWSGGPVKLVINKYTQSRTMLIHEDTDSFENMIHNKLVEELHIAITCNTKKKCQEYYDWIVMAFPEKKVKLYTGDSPLELKRDFANVNEFWLVDVLIYNNCADRGISFDIENYFDSVFANFTGSKYVSPEDCFQLLLRIRHAKNFHVLINPQKKGFYPSLNELENNIEQLSMTMAMKYEIYHHEDGVYSEENKRMVKSLVGADKNDPHYFTYLRVIRRKMQYFSGSFNEDFLLQAKTNGFSFEMVETRIRVEKIRDKITACNIHMSAQRKHRILAAEYLTEEEVQHYRMQSDWTEEIQDRMIKTYWRYVYDMDVDEKMVIEVGNDADCARYLRYKEYVQMVRVGASEQDWIEAIIGSKTFSLTNEQHKTTFEKLTRQNDNNAKVFMLYMFASELGFGGLLNGNTIRDTATIGENLKKSEWFKQNWRAMDTLFGKKRKSEGMEMKTGNNLIQSINEFLGWMGLTIVSDKPIHVGSGANRSMIKLNYKIILKPCFSRYTHTI